MTEPEPRPPQVIEAEALCEAIRSELARIELRNFALPARVEAHVHISANGYAAVALHLVATLRERDTGEPIELRFAKTIDPWSFRLGGAAEPARLAPLLEQLVVDFARHEFREAFHLDGMRLRDPHVRAEDR